MARVISVAKARPTLGSLVDEVVAKREPVVITKRAGKAAVLVVGYEEFTALQAVAEGKVKVRLQEALRGIRRAARKARLPAELVDEAVQATRGLR